MAADLPAIQRIVQAAYAPFAVRIGKPPGPMRDDYAAHVAAGVVSVATVAEAVAGLLVLFDRADHLLLDNVAVDPACQGQGIGRTLMRHAEAEAVRRGFRQIRLYTNEAMIENIATYLRAGYVETSRGRQAGYARVFFAKQVPG